MLEIKKYQYKNKCDAKRCLCTDVYSVGGMGEHPTFKQHYCEEHLKEISKLSLELFSEDTNFIEQVRCIVGAQAVTTDLQESMQVSKQASMQTCKQDGLQANNQASEELSIANEELKNKLEALTAQFDFLKEKLTQTEQRLKEPKQKANGKKR